MKMLCKLSDVAKRKSGQIIKSLHDNRQAAEGQQKEERSRSRRSGRRTASICFSHDSDDSIVSLNFALAL